jgi:hypothetical protein
MVPMHRLDPPRELDEFGQLAPVDVVIAFHDVIAERGALGWGADGLGLGLCAD